MSYYQDYVLRYLNADTKIFTKQEFAMPRFAAAKGYYIDILAIKPSSKECYLCEVSYAKRVYALRQRVIRIAQDMPQIKMWLLEKCGIPLDWTVRPWLFIKEEEAEPLLKVIPRDPKPKFTFLEKTVPWNYHDWDMTSEPGKPYMNFPEEFQ
jgi:hypothetical protein